MAAIIGALPLALPVTNVVQAAASTTVAFYSMDEAPAATALADSSGNGRTGTIGADVIKGVQFDGATGHRYPWVPTAQPPTHPEHLDRIPDATSLDPGTSDYAITVRYRTTENFGNVLQKGQNGTVGGYWKFEAPQGIVTCLFKGESGAQRAVGSVTALNDGAWHTVRCERTSTALTMFVDGAQRSRLAGTMGNISNSREITIAGKGVCDQIVVTCDYFVGDIDYVRIEKGSGGPANVAPTAAFTPSCVGLICSFSGDESTDPDGAVQTYAWTFGDGGTGAFATPNHTYATPGTYAVSLTVTDDRNGTDTVSHDVVIAPANEIISFVGLASTAGNFSTHTAVVPSSVQPGDALLMFFADNNNATIGVPTGVTGWVQLDSITGGFGTTRVYRKIAAAGDAGTTVRIPLSKQAKGSLIVAAYRGTNQGNPIAAFARSADATSTATRTTPFANVAAAQSWGVSYWMHGDNASTSLTGPAAATPRGGGTQTGSGRVTTLLADSNASLPAGPYGGLAATGAAASTTSSTWTIILGPDTGPVANVAPTAGFTSSCLDFNCSFDSSASSDSDGVIQSRTWDFGDGGTSTSTNPNHMYVDPGTYTVSLTVTDDDLAASNPASGSVTVPHQPPTNVISYVGGATQNAGASSFTVNVPAAVQPGDGLLLFLAANSTTNVSNPTGVTGWQSVGTVTAGALRSRVWRKVAVAGDAGAAVSVTLTASSKAGFTVLAYRGTSTTDPIATAVSAPLTTNSASRTSPVANVSGTQSWAISYWSHMDSISSALTPPAGVTSREGGTQTSANRVTSLIADSDGLVPTGTYGGLTAMAPAASSVGTAWTIVLAPLAGPLPNVPPTAAFTSSCVQFDCTFSSAGSSDSDGTITGYLWVFGDSSTSTDANPVHPYVDANTYPVTLIVTDDDLATSNTASGSVTVPVTTPVDVITFVGQASSNLNAVSHTVRIPVAVQAGDGLLLFFSENTTATITDPAGWTVLDTVVAGGTTTRVWRKVAVAGDANTNVTIPVSAISKAGLTVAAYRGTSNGDPVASFVRAGFTTSSTTRATPVATVTGSQSWALSYWTHKDSASDALIPPSGVTVRASGSQTSGGRITTLIADSGALVATGTYGGLSATAAAASTAGSAWTIVLAP